MVLTLIKPYLPEVIPSITGDQQTFKTRIVKAAMIISRRANNFSSFAGTFICLNILVKRGISNGAIANKGSEDISNIL